MQRWTNSGGPLDITVLWECTWLKMENRFCLPDSLSIPKNADGSLHPCGHFHLLRVVMERCSGHRSHHITGQLVVVSCEGLWPWRPMPACPPCPLRRSECAPYWAACWVAGSWKRHALFSCPLVQRLSISASSFDDVWAASCGSWKSSSTCWICISWSGLAGGGRWELHCKKRFSDFHVPSQDVTNQNLPGRE